MIERTELYRKSGWGIPNIYWRKDCWIVKIAQNKVRHYAGLFPNLETAIRARNKPSEELGENKHYYRYR